MGESKDTIKVLHWYQGTVEKILSEEDGKAKNLPVINVMWEGMSHVQGWEKGGLLKQELRNPLCNKCKEGVWRLDVDIVEVRNVDVEESNGDNEEIEVNSEGCEEMVNVGGESDSASSVTSDRGEWTSEL
jgi:hypothetical protein